MSAVILGVLGTALLIVVVLYIVRRPLLGAMSPLIATLFHIDFYRDERTWGDTKWMGAPILKNPFDLMVYQEILHELRPDLLIECGTNQGGSALFFAHLFDLIGNGRIISIDINATPGKPEHPRIEYLVMSSTSPECAAALRTKIKAGEKVMAILDSDHSAQHVRNELAAYAPLVSPGQYIVVEDTNLNGHPVSRHFGAGPMEALVEFLARNPDYQSDLTREHFKVTFHPRGWVKRLR